MCSRSVEQLPQGYAGLDVIIPEVPTTSILKRSWHAFGAVLAKPCKMNVSLLKTSITVAAFSLGIAASAQGPVFGVKGGLNYTTLAGIDSQAEKARLGFNAGLFARTMPESIVGLQVELLYSEKGDHASYDAFFGLVDQDVDFKLNYIELPVLASIRLADVVDLHFGGYAAYLVSAKLETSGDLGSATSELDRGDFKSMDFGIAGGIGFNIGKSAQLGIRYLHGLVDVENSDASEIVLDDAQNRTLQLYVAFGLGGS